MRKILFSQILVFIGLFSVIVAGGVSATVLLLGEVPLGDFRGVVLLLAGLAICFAFAIVVFRLFLLACPLRPGLIEPGSGQEFVYHVYLLFFLIIFYPVMRSGAMPVPLMRLVYQGLGAKLGENTYSSGILLDPPFVQIGANTLVGQYALLVPHVIENDRLAHYPIRIGDRVTIGAHAVVLPGVTIEDDALVATGAIVKKGTHIRAGEVWSGVPARRLRGPEAEGEV